MAQNPKYDNDMVNLGYLNKRLGQTEESISKNNNSISQLPKNYSTPPNPPYYKDSLLCYGNKIYRCNNTKLKGEFSWNDWSIVATDDTAISDFINNTYEVEKLEIQEQIDGKIQTHYQENDPSKDWTTDLEKGRHVGDYWYNTSDNTQWRYNQITTGPTITYGWGQVNIPKSVFDTIDRKKSIYTEKPTSYKKDDLWIIEETLSDDDLPIGTDENPIAKGDWVFSIADSEEYNKEHWVKRDEDVSLSYLEQHYYTITEIDSNLEVIERNTESKITKATEEISLNVSQTYTTKEEHTKAINDFDKQIGTINNTIIEQKETLSDLSVEVGEVSASVSSVETRTEELLVDVNGVKENIIPTATATGSSIYIQDASNNPLTYLEIEGKSTQEVRSGKNLFNINDTTPNTLSQTDGVTLTTNNSMSLSNYIRIEPNETYKAQCTIQDFIYRAFFYDESKNYIGTNTFRDTMSYNAYYVRLQMNKDFANANFQLEKGTTATEYEQYGASPSHDYPSEIESVGYTNLFDKDNANILKAYLSSEKIVSSTNARVIYIPCNPNTTYKIQKVIGNAFSIAYAENTPNIGTAIIGRINTKSSPTLTITTGANAKYLVSQIMDSGDTLTEEEILNSIQIEEGSTAHSYIPYGKYGIEVKTVGKNLFNKENIIDGWIRASDNKYWNEAGTFSCTDYIKVKPNTTYTLNLHNATSLGSGGIMEYDNKKVWLNIGLPETNKLMTFTTSENTYYIRFTVRNESVDYIQLEESSVETEYQPYQERIITMQLNAPLRSLPNGVKDIAYIKNNKLYVDRYVGSVVLNGSENWAYSTSNGYPRCRIIIDDLLAYTDNSRHTGRFISSHFIPNTTDSIGHMYQYQDVIYCNPTSDITSADAFKTWLSTHNTQVDYQLATPVTEDYGEIEMLKTLKGYNNISTTDKLEPIINLTYVRDTVIADYVENHVTELKLTEKEIKASVESVSSSVDGLNTTINRVEEITNDNSQVINVISTNIDKSTGEVREVTTTTGFTFNADGMTIDDGSGFKAQHRANGTYYKDGESIVGQYTKDGSKQKDLELFGTYSYGKETIDDTPMFIGQLYTNENGEQAFGHFYNGEG